MTNGTAHKWSPVTPDSAHNFDNVAWMGETRVIDEYLNKHSPEDTGEMLTQRPIIHVI